MNRTIIVGMMSAFAILMFETFPVDNTINNAITMITFANAGSSSITTKISSSPELPQLSPPPPLRIEAMKSSYHIVELYGMRDSHNIAVRIGSIDNVSVIYYNNRHRSSSIAIRDSNNDSKKKIYRISTRDVMSAISDGNALSIFKAIAVAENNKNNTRILMTKSKLSYRQYYLSREKLMHAGLIRRISSNYSLTSFGRIVFSKLEKLELAINCYLELKIVDSFMTSVDNKELSIQEYHMLIDKLISDREIKDILLSDSKDEPN